MHSSSISIKVGDTHFICVISLFHLLLNKIPVLAEGYDLYHSTLSSSYFHAVLPAPPCSHHSTAGRPQMLPDCRAPLPSVACLQRSLAPLILATAEACNNLKSILNQHNYSHLFKINFFIGFHFECLRPTNEELSYFHLPVQGHRVKMTENS